MRPFALLCCFLTAAAPLAAQQTPPTQLTIYNGNFALVRTTVPLDLHPGANEVLTADVTRQLEPDSVVLRDPAGKRTIPIAEQNYDAGVVNQQTLLGKYEGQILDFRVGGNFVAVTDSGQTVLAQPKIVRARLIRAGGDGGPLVEVAGTLSFGLPGSPIFPISAESLQLKPTLRWMINTNTAARFPAELDYITKGMQWAATYNLIVPEAPALASTERGELVGWVTVTNNTGTDFPAASLQLMAGDVAKLQDVNVGRASELKGSYATTIDVSAGDAITQNAFDDFHLYNIPRTVTLRDKESKQIQFLDAAQVNVTRSYKVHGNQPGNGFFADGDHNVDRNFGVARENTVAIYEEIKNSEANHLGMPLPAGRLRLYRQEADGKMQFVGEGTVPHRAAEQTLNVTSGNAFDLTAKQRQTAFHVEGSARIIDESFEVTLSNAKQQPVVIHVIEHMNRSQNWDITDKSAAFDKKDASTIDFPVAVPARGDATLTYTVHYTW